MDALTILVNPSAEYQASHANALAEGLRRHSVEVKVQDRTVPVRTHHVACWGWRNGVRQRSHGHDVLVMERGYLGDRFAWTSMGWNGLNGLASFGRRSDPGRFNRNFSPLLRPWRTGGKYVLLLGQVPGDMSLAGRDLKPWYRSMVRDAEKAYGLPVIFRPHPRALELGYGVMDVGAPANAGPLDEALSDAAIAVTWNSNSAVDAVLAGVPTVTMDSGAMAYPVTGHEIGERLTPDRAAWASELAWKQWTLDEIRNGTAWDVVREGLLQ